MISAKQCYLLVTALKTETLDSKLQVTSLKAEQNEALGSYQNGVVAMVQL